MNTTTDLQRLSGLVEIMAAERTHTAGRPELFEDCVQEGLIAAWQAATKRPDAPAAYVHAAARQGVGSPLRGRPLTGAPRQRGLAREDALDRSMGFTAADEEIGEDWKDYSEDASAAEALERVESVDAVTAVRRVVAALPQADQRVIHLRFVEGLGWPQIAARLDKKTEAVRRRFLQVVAPQLRAELARFA